MKNLVLNLRNANAQAGCATSSRMAKLLTTLLILTLGFGQVWADNAVTVYCAINASTMKSGDNCYTLKVNANIGDNNTWRQYTMNIVDKTKNGKLIYSATIYEKYGGVDALQFQLYQGSTWKAQKQPYSSWTTSNTFSGKLYDYDAGSWSAYSGLDDATTVYYVNTSSWGTPKAFAWSGCTNNAAWSGQTMTSTGKTYNGKTIYSISFNKRFENIIFSNNGSSQTADLTLGSTNAGKMYDNGTWRAYNYDVSITFNMQGHGDAPSDITVIKGNTATAPSNPSATGYTFGGWYTNSACTTAWSWSTAVNDDKILYAKWTAKTTTITLNNQSATSAGTEEVTATYDAAMPAITLPEKDGYTFGGYYGAPGGGGPKYYNADGSSAQNWDNENATYTLFAKWTENMSTVTLTASPSGKGTFQVGGATVTSTTAGVTTTRSVTAVPISGYRFAGWSISGGATISSTSTNPTTVTGGGAGTAATLTATFEEDLTYYTLKFGARSGETSYGSVAAVDGSGSSLTSNSDYLSGTSVTVTATATDDDYKFDCWYNAWTGGSSVSTDNPLTFTLTAATSRYAHFVQKTTTVTINTNGGSGGSSSFTATHGSTLPSFTMPARSGYTLTGLWTASSGGTKIVNADKTLVASVSGYTTSGKKWDYDDPTLTLYAQWTENMTTVTVNVSPAGTGTLTVGGAAFTPGNTTTAGKTTSRTVVATAANDYTFNNWTTAGNATGTNSTNTYTLKGNGSAGTGTLTANFTLIPVKLLYGNSTPLNSPTDGGAMSYDATEHAYYIDVTTNSSPYYFRFDYNSNSEQYSGNWSGTYPGVVEATGDGTKVDCNQTVKGWDNKASIKYTGANRSSIRIWFDYQNKKAWITEPTYTVSVAAGANGSVSPTSVSGVGASVASSDITATPDKGYVFTGWTLPSGTSAAAGYSASSNPIRINATAGSKTITANFAAATAFIEGRFHITNASRNGTWTNTFSGGNWDESSTRIKFTWDGTNNRYELHTYAQPKELSTQISSNNPYFYVKESSSTSSLENVTSYWPSTSQTLTAAGTGNKKSLVSSGPFHNDYLRFNSSDESGYTVLYFDEAGVWYELEQTLKYNANGGTGSTPAMAYYMKGTNATAAPANTYTKEGYNFSGWKTEASGGTSYAAGASVPMNSNITLYAQWTPKQTTVSFDANTSAEGYRSGSAPSSVTATYNAAMPSISIGVTAQDGYACIGYFDDPVDGTQYYDGTGASVKNWDKTGATATLYAHYKKAQITAQTFSPSSIVAPNTALTVTVTVDPTPTGTTSICWRLLQNNGNPVDPQPGFTWENEELTFKAPAVGGTYKLEATLRLGSECDGTILDQDTANLVVANDHTVTVLYKCGDATIKSSTEAPAKPLDWTSITAPDIVGYTFSKWKAGDGVTIEGADSNGEKASATINYKAIYDGTLTAIYTKKNVIYFYNTVGWSDVWVYFYTSDKYWANDWGTGAYKGKEFESNKQFWDMHYGQMTQIEGTNIWYFDYTAKGWDGWPNIAFANMNKAYSGEDNTSDNDKAFFSNTTSNPIQVIRRGDHKTTLSMFVPLTGQTKQKKNNNKAEYLSDGYWMNYPENTGYTLKLYSSQDATTPTRTIRFPFSADTKMPLKLDVELNEAATDYFYTIYREDGAVLSASYGMNTNYHSDVQLNNPNTKISIKTTAPGIYTYTLVYKNTPATNYYISVDYPIGKDDYRVWYSDNAKWSQSSAHAAGWYHPSDVIRKNTDAEVTQYDTVSFFVSVGSSPSMKFQYASAVGENGKITWADVASGGITLSDFSSVITKAGVYNFIIKQVGTARPVLENVEPYTGNYYIRTDNAGNTKWDSYKSLDHQMTYTEFSRNRSTNTFGELYTHYYAHWCERGTNIKFCVANDYSSCISDTLAQDVDDPYKNTDAEGTLKIEDPAKLPVNDRYSANVRFMYNETTNKICRAYVASSTDHSRLFLVLRGGSEVHGDDNLPISDQGITNGVILDDKQNWIYERELKILPGTRFKLFACYAEASPTQANAQYFRGAYDSEQFTNDDNSVILVDGDPAVGYQNVRVIYDFKTNRLVCAWIPDNSSVTGDLPIHADVMVIREHQEAAKQITFTNAESKLSQVLTVYGAMKFNRWVLNNKSTAAGHAVLDPSDQKSIYERALYFISFPFDVNLSEVFGFGTYGVHWIIENYDGLNRAKNGYWIDSPPNWKYVTNPNGYILEAKKGYILCLDLELMKDDNETFWSNGIETIELFFPSTTTYGTIQQTTATIDALGEEYRCTINRGEGTEGDRRIKDSFWRCIGVPSFANYSSTLSDGSGTITWQTGNSLPYLYEWNMTDNSLTPQGTSNYAFKAMHAYLAQCQSAIVWTATSSKPSSIAARYSDNEMLKDREFRLQLDENGVKKDQTFIRLSIDEAVSAGFEFGNDMSKEMNANKSNIYTFIGTDQAAANSLPLSTEQTTIVPVGVVANAAGEYTFSIPEGTDGIGVTFIDNETGIHTQLGALDYTVTLDKGTYESRFYLEISPIHGTPTGVGAVTGDGLQVTGVRKVIIDQNMYIIRDGKMYNVQGARCN